MDIAVIGNSPINAGLAVAADMALAGHTVRYAPWPGDEASLEPLRRQGGIALAGDPTQSAAGRTGLARPTLTEDVGAALRGAALVFLDMPAAEFERRFAPLVPSLARDQVVHVNIHGYWPAMRLWPLLKAAGRSDITITEAPAPTIAAAAAAGTVTLQCLRRELPVAAFPAMRRDRALTLLRAAYPTGRPAESVLETGFAGLNMMIHAAMAILNVGWFDRAQAANEKADFYAHANTRHSALLAQAQDDERKPVCAAYGVGFRPLAAYLRDYYGARGQNLGELVRNCAYYQSIGPLAPDAWDRWMQADVPYAHVPFVALAELAGVKVPLHRAFVDISSALHGRDYWTDGITAERLGVAGMDAAGVGRYVREGAA